MKTNCTWLSILILVAVSMTGCGKKGLSELPVFPVKGTVKVDGKPEMGVTVKLHPVNGVDTAHPTYPEGITLPDGTFSITTYATNDGAPIGEYKVTFFLRRDQSYLDANGGRRQTQQPLSRSQEVDPHCIGRRLNLLILV